MTAIHIHAPRGYSWVEYTRCPTCERRTLFLARMVPWYGQDETCTRCGDSWQDGEMMPRPFARGWRAESIRQAMARLPYVYSSRKAAIDALIAAEKRDAPGGDGVGGDGEQTKEKA